jgi:AraC family transcriptional regulator, positive regulator of tynA and feaB
MSDDVVMLPAWKHVKPVSVADWSRWLATIALPGDVSLSSGSTPGCLETTRLSTGGRLAHIQLNPQTIEHQHAHLIATPNASVLVHIVLEGEGMIEQDGEALNFSAGDITYRTIQRPSYIHFATPSRLAVLNLPAQRLNTLSLSKRPWWRAQMIRQQSPLAGLIRQTTDCLLGFSQTAVHCHQNALEQSLVLLLASAYQEKLGARVTADSVGNPTRWRQIMLFIEANFADDALSPQVCANHVGVSERYLHRLFSERGMTFSQTVQVLRLDLAKAMLQQYPSADISTIAFQSGFISAAHFSRCFKQRFNVTPSTFRAARAAVSGHADSLLDSHEETFE